MKWIWALACLSTLAVGCAREADVVSGAAELAPAAVVARAGDARLVRAAAETPPVLLPSDPALRSRARVTPAGSGYTANVDLRGASVQITGAPGGGAAGGVLVQRTEYGVDASFSRDGGVYNLTLTCEASADARCAGERFIRAFASGLTPR